MTRRTSASTCLISALTMLLLAAGGCDDEPGMPLDQGSLDATDQGVPDQNTADAAALDQSAPDQAASDQSTLDQAVLDQAPPDRPAPDQVALDMPLPDQAVPDMPSPDMPLPDQAVPDMPSPDQAAPDMPSPDQAAPDLPSPDQTVPDMPLPTCTDGKHNGVETDIDCGGGTCPKCAEKKKCTQAKDCISGVCTGGLCHPPAKTIASGKTVYFEDLAAVARVKAISGTKLTLESLAAAAKFALGHEVLLINMQGSSSDAASVGNHELLDVASVAAADVVLIKAPARVYGDNKSNISLTNQKVFLVQVPRYSTLTINGTLAARLWSGTAKGLGLVVVRATVKLEVAAGGAVTTSQAGYRSAGYSCNGVSGLPGESLAPWPVGVPGTCHYKNPTGKPNFGGGGGGLSNCNTYSCSTQMIGAGGGGAGYALAGVAGQNNGTKQKGGLAGLQYGKVDLSQIFLGSGGGQGAGGYSGPGGGTGGGQGGGLIYLLAPTLVVKGGVTANGKKGGENANCTMTHGSGSGGGGSGGSVHLSGQTVSLTAGKVTALGAKGGCRGGGAGSTGRIRVDYATLNGAAYPGGAGALTNPVAYTAKY